MKLKRDEPILRRIERFTVRSNQFFRERLRGQEKEKEKKKKEKSRARSDRPRPFKKMKQAKS